MLYRVKHFYANRLESLEGERVGHVADCYFDDRTWTLLFFAVDTDWWTPLRRVLIPPQALRSIPRHGRVLPVSLSRRQIENGPTLGVNETVTARHMEEWFRHYNWPFYWQGASMWGPAYDTTSARGQAPRQNTVPSRTDLRSVRSFFGYSVNAHSEPVGKVEDVLVDSRQWHIQYLDVILHNHWFPREALLISTRKVVTIDWQGQSATVAASRDELDRAADSHADPAFA